MTTQKPWYWRQIPLKNRTGSQIFDTLFRAKTDSKTPTETIATLLESRYIKQENCQPLCRYSICAGPPG